MEQFDVNRWFAGKLCGLTPESSPTSEQIHLVVELALGIRDDEDDHLPRNSRGKLKPVEKLKEALSSKSAFQRCYLVRLETNFFPHLPSIA